MIITIDVAQTILVFSIVGVLVAVLFFKKETAHKRLLQLLEVVAKILIALFKLFNK